MEKIGVVKWKEGINLKGFSRQEIFDSINIYEKRNFECEKIDNNYFLLIRKPT